MKKAYIAVLILAIVGLGGFALMKNSGSDSKSATAVGTNSSNKKSAKSACDLLTLDDAKTLLGGSAYKTTTENSSNLATTNEVTVDNCSYSVDGEKLSDTKQITIQIHSGEPSLVKQSYENFIKEFPGTGIADLGDTANLSTEGLNVRVLKGNAWILTFGGSIGSSSQELSTQAAKVALAKL